MGMGLLRLVRECSRIPSDWQHLDETDRDRFLDLFTEIRPCYLRVAAIPANRGRLYLVSVGNLLAKEGKIGVTSCSQSRVARATEHGFLCHRLQSLSSKRRKFGNIHDPVHAYNSSRATWVLSVPIVPLQDKENCGAPLGFLTVGWPEEPMNQHRYICIVQQVAAELAGGFQAALSPILQDAIEYFLPSVEDPALALGISQSSLPAPACKDDWSRPDDSGQSPGGPEVPAGTLTSSLAKEAAIGQPGGGVQEILHAKSWKAGQGGPTGHPGGRDGISGSPPQSSSEGTGLQQRQKSGSLWSEGGNSNQGTGSLENHWGSGLDKAVHGQYSAEQEEASAVWEDDDVELEKKRQRGEQGVRGPGVSDLVPQDPYFLTFHDPNLESAFVRAQANSRSQIDLVFAIFASGVCLGLMRDPVTWANGTAFISFTASALQLLAILQLPQWYAKHREVYCCFTALAVTIGSAAIWTSYVASPLALPENLAQLPLRQIVVEPCIQATVCVGHKIRFRTAAVWRASLILPIGLYLIQRVVGTVWGLPPSLAIAIAAVPLVGATSGMLCMLRHWERDERRAFLASRPL